MPLEGTHLGRFLGHGQAFLNPLAVGNFLAQLLVCLLEFGGTGLHPVFEHVVSFPQGGFGPLPSNESSPALSGRVKSNRATSNLVLCNWVIASPRRFAWCR